MAGKPWRLGTALVELRRRHVYRVTGAYAITAWVVVEVADVVVPALMAPAWVMTAVVVLAALGLPVAMVLAWAFDITPEGVVRTSRIDSDASHAVRWNWRWLDYIIIALLLGILSFLAVRPGEPPLRQPIGRSIAVLPFTDLSRERDTGYFSEGMAEGILDGLATIPDLEVAARTSSFAFGHRETTVREIAEALKVSILLEGSVRKSGERVRISTRLIDGQSGHSFWNQSFDGFLDDIFSLQDATSRAIVDALQIHLADNLKLVDRLTEDPVAYDYYLRGRSGLRKEPTEANIRTAIGYFRQALERDPAFGLAQAGMCTGHWQLYETTRETAHVERALSTCEQARLQDPDRAETQVALGRIHSGRGEPEQALAAFGKALDLEPDNSAAHVGLGLVQERLGNFEVAEVNFKRAIELDPAWWRNYSYLGGFYFGQGKYREAATQFEQAIRLEPGSPRSYSNRGGALLHLGEFEDAAEAFGQSITREPTATAYSNAGTSYFLAGNYAAAESMIWVATELRPEDYRYQAFLAETMTLNGKTAEATERFQRAMDLARARLEVNPADADCRASLVLFLARTGARELARAERDRMPPDMGPGAATTHRTLALAAMSLGERDTALDHLRLAIDGGWPVIFLAAEPFLAPLHDDPRFVALVGHDRTHVQAR